MNDDAQLEVLGDPPRVVRATEQLPPAAIAAMLQAPSVPALCELLGITGRDHIELSALIDPAVEDQEVLAEITATANLLRAEAGLDVAEAALGAREEAQTALQQRLAEFHEAGRQCPFAKSRMNRTPAQQHALVQVRHGADDVQRVLVVDRRAGRTDRAHARVAVVGHAVVDRRAAIAAVPHRRAIQWPRRNDVG